MTYTRNLCALAFATILTSGLTPGCVHHIYPYEPKVRDYQLGEYAEPEAGRTAGSLWSEATPGLFSDLRAARVGDILTVVVNEEADATRAASTKSKRKNETKLGASAFLTAMTKLTAANPGLDPSALISAASESNFEGDGTTQRTGSVRATLPVRIRERLPNGDFFVEGSKVLLLNDEESQLYLSGVVRPVDIGPSNNVSSSLLADVELEYTGRGVLTDRQSPGWMSRVLDVVWPF